MSAVDTALKINSAAGSARQSYSQPITAICFMALWSVTTGCVDSSLNNTRPDANGGSTAFNTGEFGIAHSERKRRLEELSAQSKNISPSFFEYLVRMSDIPGGTTDQPVLRVVFDERVFFDTGSSKVRPEGLPVLEVVAKVLRSENGQVAVFVAGHTDSRGSDAYNLELSIRRASEVAQKLARRDIGKAKIWRVGFGKAVPLRPNDSAENMGLNRRVEFVLASKPDAVTAWLAKQRGFLCSENSADSPEVCKESYATTATFKAVPVDKGSQGIAANLKGSEQKNVPLERIHPVEIIMQPSIIQVERPSR